MISLIYISTLDAALLIEQNPAIGFDVSLSLSFCNSICVCLLRPKQPVPNKYPCISFSLPLEKDFLVFSIDSCFLHKAYRDK